MGPLVPSIAVVGLMLMCSSLAWGETTQECMVSGGGKTEWQLSPAPVTYTYKGVESYRGRQCQVFTSRSEFMFPGTYYFDAAAGELVGLEQRLRQDTVGSAACDIVLQLEPAAKAATGAPAAESQPPTAAASR
jgi:hypothetical protein